MHFLWGASSKKPKNTQKDESYQRGFRTSPYVKTVFFPTMHIAIIISLLHIIPTLGHTCIHDEVSVPLMNYTLADFTPSRPGATVSTLEQPLALRSFAVWGEGEQSCSGVGARVAVGTPTTESLECWAERGVVRNCWLQCTEEHLATDAVKRLISEVVGDVARFLHSALAVRQLWGILQLNTTVPCRGHIPPSWSAGFNLPDNHALLISDDALLGERSDTFALSMPCQYGPDHRPVFSYLGISPKRIKQFMDENQHSGDLFVKEYLFAVVLHEITHSLGFSQGLYAFWYPRDHLNSDNVENKKYFFANPGRFPTGPVSGDAVLFDSNVTEGEMRNNIRFAFGTTAGRKKVAYFSTPAVLRAGAEHFNCSKVTDGGTLFSGTEVEGIEIEDASPSHFEKRILYEELMTAEVKGVAVLSNLTLALLSDTGWYTINESAAGSLAYAKESGCEVLDPTSCEGIPASELCSTEEAEVVSCSADGVTMSSCTVQSYYDYFQEGQANIDLAGSAGESGFAVFEALKEIPNRLFGDVNLGGDKFADFCGIRRRSFTPDFGNDGVASCTSFASRGPETTFGQCFATTTVNTKNFISEFYFSGYGLECPNVLRKQPSYGTTFPPPPLHSPLITLGNIRRISSCQTAAVSANVANPNPITISDSSLPKGCFINWDLETVYFNEIPMSRYTEPTLREYDAYIEGLRMEGATLLNGHYRVTPVCVQNGEAPLPSCLSSICSEGKIYVRIDDEDEELRDGSGVYYHCPERKRLRFIPESLTLSGDDRAMSLGSILRPSYEHSEDDIVLASKWLFGGLECPTYETRCHGGAERDNSAPRFPEISSFFPKILSTEGGDVVAVVGNYLSASCTISIGEERTTPLSFENFENGTAILRAHTTAFVRRTVGVVDVQVNVVVLCPSNQSICHASRPNCLGAYSVSAALLSTNAPQRLQREDLEALGKEEDDDEGVPWYIWLAIAIGICVVMSFIAFVFKAGGKWRRKTLALDEEEGGSGDGAGDVGGGVVATKRGSEAYRLSADVHPVDMKTMRFKEEGAE